MPADTATSTAATRPVSPLQGAEVHVWLCRHDAVADSDTLRRTVLSHYAPVAPADWRFSRGKWGKPAIVDTPVPLAFNLSHSGEWLACGVSPGLELGVDLECFKARRDVLKLARRFFHPAEAAALESLPPAQVEDTFYDLWTLKEAHVKCRGLPLPPALETVGFELRGSDGVLRHAATDDSVYCLLEPLPHHRLALNWRAGPAGPPVLRLFGFDGEAAAPWPAPGLRRASREVAVAPEPATTG